jgi:hypothetical protein
MNQVLVQTTNDHPICDRPALLPATLFPAVVEEIELGENKGIRVGPDESPYFDPGVPLQQIDRSVGRAIVENHIPRNDWIVVPEKEYELPRVVPARRIEMYDWLHFGSPHAVTQVPVLTAAQVEDSFSSHPASNRSNPSQIAGTDGVC